jgi:hypothetical protein
LRAGTFLLDLSGGCRFDPLCLGASGFLGLFDHRLGAFVCGLNDSGRLAFGVSQLLAGLLLRDLKVMPSTIGGCKAVRDLVLPLCHGASDRGPHVTHTESHKCHKGN